MSGDVSIGREFLAMFAASLEAVAGPDAASQAFEVLSEEECGEIALRHLVPASEVFVRAYVELHGSAEGIDEAAAAAGVRPSEATMVAIFEETAALFRERTGEE